MTNFNWRIEQLERQVSHDGIVVAYWRVKAEDGEYVAEAYGSVNFTPDPLSPNFIPYAELTEQQVLSWVWSQVNKKETEALLTTIIQSKKNPVVVNGLPW